MTALEIPLLTLILLLVFYIFRLKKNICLKKSYDVLSDIMGSFEHMILNGHINDDPPSFRFHSKRMFDEVLNDIRVVVEKYKYAYQSGVCNPELSEFTISKKDSKLSFRLYCMHARAGSPPGTPLLYFLIPK
jgi:hypothetical protein